MKHSFLILAVCLFFSLPAFARVMVINGLTHEFNVRPGMAYKQAIDLQNVSTSEQTVLISQTDYHFTHKSEAFYEKPGSKIRSNADWIRLSQNTVLIHPNESRSVVLDINVPNDSTLNGTHWSVVMVEMASIPTATTIPGVNMRTVVRYAIQIITHFENTGTSNLFFLETRVEIHDSLSLFNVVIENSGDRMLRHTVFLEVFDQAGEKIGEFVSDQGRTYPGTSILSTFDITQISPGTYQAHMYADCENDDFFGTMIQLEVPRGVPKNN